MPRRPARPIRARSCRTPGTIARFYKAVADAHLAHIIKVDLASAVFTYEIDERALNRARLMDGKLILVSNVPDLPPAEIVAALQGAGRHRTGIPCPEVRDRDRAGLPPPAERIRAHALICFLALLLYRVLRLRLKAKASPLSPERALEIARRIQYHQVTLHQRQSASGLSAITPQQKELFETVALPEPSARRL
jgi:hypothetical protein